MNKENGWRLFLSEAEKITNEGERLFALACLEVGCKVFYQIPVGASNIDFLVVNPKAKTRGKLVEVTMEKREDMEKMFVTRMKDGKEVIVANTTGFRKQRQIESMKDSGRKWTILFNEEIRNLRRKKT